jgi:hypothetical protein
LLRRLMNATAALAIVSANMYQPKIQCKNNPCRLLPQPYAWTTPYVSPILNIRVENIHLLARNLNITVVGSYVIN